jgi:prepilin-type N-terminal cleavage/methylation domain-containing protein
VKLATRRRGFTLLEVLLASLIALLLLSALYFAMDITLRQTQQSRDNVDVDNLARGVFTRINMDLASSLAPLPPKSGGNAAPSTSSSASSSTTASSASAAAPTGAGTTAPDPSATTTTTVTMSGDAAAAPQAADVGFQAGIMGTDKQLTVFHSRVPLALTTVDGLSAASSDVATPSDLYRVTYWISAGSGLCRQERPWVTADGIRDNTDPDYSTEATDVLAPEITDATFEYFDGTTWQSSWNPDGSTMSDDGVTPIGPPRAVRVTLNFSFPSSRPNGTAYETTLVKVIPVRAAPGSLTPTMIAPSTDTGSDASGSSASTPAASGSNGSMGASGTSGASTGATGGGGAMGGASSAPKASTPAPAASSAPKANSPAPAAPTTGGAKGGGR